MRRLFLQAKVINRSDAVVSDLITSLAAGVAPLFFLTVRSWTNGFLLVLLALAIHGLFTCPKDFRSLLADTRVRWVLGAMASAFLAILVSQLMRFEIMTPAYDAPARMLASCLVFLHLATRCIDVVRIFQWTFPLSVLFTAVSLVVNQQPFDVWVGRWATYFVDPLSLGQYALLLGFLSLFSINLVEKDRPWAIALKLAGFIVGVGISIGSASRSAWVALPALAAIWLIVILRVRNVAWLAASFAAIAAACILSYTFVEVVHLRLNSALNDYIAYFSGELDSPGGTRLSLLRVAWHLFLNEPLRGYGDGGYPPLLSVPAVRDFYSETLDYALHHHGTHNEIAQNMIRSGVFGLISAVLLFVVPLVLFWRAALSGSGSARNAAVLGLGYIVAVFLFGINTETFTLKYLSTFYGLMVATLGAQVIWGSPALVRNEPYDGRCRTVRP